jgi:tetratricopeptide (TPR) repeat protein
MYDDDKIRFLPDCSRGPETAAQRDARLGRQHLKKGEWDKSMSYLTAAIVFEPDNAGYWLDLGRALLGMGDSQLARDAWYAGLVWSHRANDEALVAELEASLAKLSRADVAE